MGLDMYLIGDKYISEYDHSQQGPDGRSLRVKRPVIDGFEITSYKLDLGYWRKFGPLHDYIVKVFADGVDDCRPIDLDSDDCRRIAAALRDGGLPENDDVVRGCFFGSDEMWDEDRAQSEEHAKLFDKAADFIDAAPWNSVTYVASW
jgi:hypothetical protein